MKEYIEREAAIKANCNICPMLHECIGEDCANRNVIRAIPAADVVEVVRCKDCKHSYFVKSCSKYECTKGCGTLKYSNDFCSYGAKMDGKGEGE